MDVGRRHGVFVVKRFLLASLVEWSLETPRQRWDVVECYFDVLEVSWLSLFEETD